MKETKFIEQNKEKWAQFDQQLQAGQRDPEQLNKLFIEITDDLSYARTFYPNRSVRVFMNQMAQRIFHNIYRGKKTNVRRFFTFWTDELPQTIWESRRALQLSLAVFVLAFGIGVLSCMINPDFARVVMGDDYVEMTLSNIEKGDPMAVYKDSHQTAMFAGIAVNNLWVALKTALFGIFASIGTLFMMLYNGIMVGAFQYFFIEKGLFAESFLTIWIHGTLEISAIIIAGGAGLVAGSGLLFPGSFTRSQAFQVTMRRGLKIFLGIVPIIIFAAILEGFVTRYTEMHWVARLMIILLSLLFILAYFVWLPWRKAQRGEFTANEQGEDLQAQGDHVLDFNAIKSSGEVVGDLFTIMRRHPSAILATIFGGAAIFTVCSVLLSDQPVQAVFEFPGGMWGIYDGICAFFGTGFLDLQRWLLVSLLTVVAVIGHVVITKEWGEEDQLPWSAARIAGCLSLMLPVFCFLGFINIDFLQSVLGIGSNWFVFIAYTLSFLLFIFFASPLPMFGIWAATIFYETNNPFLALYKSISRLRFSFGHLIWLGTFVAGFGIMLVLLMDTEIWKIMCSFFSWLVPPGELNMQIFSTLITTFMASAVLIFWWLVIVIGGSIQYFSMREISEAPHLLNGIENVGNTQMIRGIAKE